MPSASMAINRSSCSSKSRFTWLMEPPALRRFWSRSALGRDCVKTRLSQGRAELFSQLPSPNRSRQCNRFSTTTKSRRKFYAQFHDDTGGTIWAELDHSQIQNRPQEKPRPELAFRDGAKQKLQKTQPAGRRRGVIVSPDLPKTNPRLTILGTVLGLANCRDVPFLPSSAL